MYFFKKNKLPLLQTLTKKAKPSTSNREAASFRGTNEFKDLHVESIRKKISSYLLLTTVPNEDVPFFRACHYLKDKKIQVALLH